MSYDSCYAGRYQAFSDVRRDNVRRVADCRAELWRDKPNAMA